MKQQIGPMMPKWIRPPKNMVKPERHPRQRLILAFHFGQYQPLTWMTFGLDHVLWWADPFGHHWTNLLLHLGNTLLFYYVGLALLSYLRAGNSSADSTGSRATAGI